MKRSDLNRYLPLAYFVCALVLAASLLPTTLRPPPQQPPTSAQLDADAPEDPEVLLTELNRGGSATAGAGIGVGPGPLVEAAPHVKAAAPARACPHGVGVPPRQVESVYSAGCAAPWAGNNGGETSKGVTATEIRVGVRGTKARGGGSGSCATNGPLDGRNVADMNSGERTYYVFQQYFNRNFQFYGRRLRFFCVDPDNQSVEGDKAMARRADSEYKIFGLPLGDSWGGNACDEYARLKIVSFCEDMSAAWFQARAPYVWSVGMNGTEIWTFWTEYICKKLAGKPARFAGDPVLQQTMRKFAIVGYDTRDYAPVHTAGQRQLKERCGIDAQIMWVNLDNANGEAGAATTVSRLKADNVTTVIFAAEYVIAATLTTAASSQGYVPEWFHGDFVYNNSNEIGQLQNQAQWAHAFGVSGREPERALSATECARAYRSIDPDNNPDGAVCYYMWRVFPVFFSGIQMAGPHLTPHTFQEGLFKIGMRYYDRPRWAVGGGYAPGVYSYPHNVTEMWWDPTALDPRNNRPGAYRHTNEAKRLCLGQLTDDTSRLFNEGVTTPDDALETAYTAPTKTCPRA